MSINKEIKFYSNSLAVLMNTLQSKKRGIKSESPYEMYYRNNAGQGILTAVQSYYDYSTAEWVLADQEFGNLNVQEITTTGLVDEFLASSIPISQTGISGLVGFTNTSIVGCLNELKTEISRGADSVWTYNAPTATTYPTNANYVNIKLGLTDDSILTPFPLTQLGNTSLSTSYSANSIIGCFNEIASGFGNIWEIDSTELRVKPTLSYDSMTIDSPIYYDNVSTDSSNGYVLFRNVSSNEVFNHYNSDFSLHSFSLGGSLTLEGLNTELIFKVRNNQNYGISSIGVYGDGSQYAQLRTYGSTNFGTAMGISQINAGMLLFFNPTDCAIGTVYENDLILGAYNKELLRLKSDDVINITSGLVSYRDNTLTDFSLFGSNDNVFDMSDGDSGFVFLPKNSLLWSNAYLESGEFKSLEGGGSVRLLFTDNSFTISASGLSEVTGDTISLTEVIRFDTNNPGILINGDDSPDGNFIINSVLGNLINAVYDGSALNQGANFFGWYSGDHSTLAMQLDAVTGILSIGTGHTVSGDYSIVSGINHNVSGAYNMVGGNTNTIFGDDNVVSGGLNTVDGDFNIVGGSTNAVDGLNNVVSGTAHAVYGDLNIVGGDLNEVSNNYCLVSGNRLTTAKDRCLIIGQYNDPQSDSVFEIGWGSSGSETNIFRIDESGSIYGAGNLFVDGMDSATSGNMMLYNTTNGQLEYNGNLTLGVADGKQKLQFQSANGNMAEYFQKFLGETPGSSVITAFCDDTDDIFTNNIFARIGAYNVADHSLNTILGIPRSGVAFLTLFSKTLNDCVIGTASNSDLIFSTNNTKRATLDTSGNLTLENGNLFFEDASALSLSSNMGYIYSDFLSIINENTLFLGSNVYQTNNPEKLVITTGASSLVIVTPNSFLIQFAEAVTAGTAPALESVFNARIDKINTYVPIFNQGTIWNFFTSANDQTCQKWYLTNEDDDRKRMDLYYNSTDEILEYGTYDGSGTNLFISLGIPVGNNIKRGTLQLPNVDDKTTETDVLYIDDDGYLTKGSISSGTCGILKFSQSINIGDITTGSSTNETAYFIKWVAPADMDITHLAVFITYSGTDTFEIGFYDSSGDLQAQGSSSVSAEQGIHKIAITAESGGSTSVTAGTEYWLALWMDSGSANFGYKTGLIDEDATKSDYDGTGLPSDMSGATIDSAAVVPWIGVYA